MKLFDKVEPVFIIDEEDNALLKSIDSKLSEIKVIDKQKRKITVERQYF